MTNDRKEPKNPNSNKRKVANVFETTTKVIVATVVMMWVTSYIAMFVIWVISDRFNRELLDVINVVAVPVIISYCVKSGYEFKVRHDTFEIDNRKRYVSNDENTNDSVG